MSAPVRRPAGMTVFRYVTHERVHDYMLVGWAWAADLGDYHGQYSCLMVWPCKCPPVEPMHKNGEGHEH
jgi:hypothetical protein